MAMNSSNVTAGNNAKASEYNNLRTDVRLGISDPQTDEAGVIDLSTGKIFKRTLDGVDDNISFSNPTAGQTFILILKQDGTGSRTVTWPTIKWVGATAPTLTTTANRADIFAFFYDGTDYYGSIVGVNFG